MTWRKLIEEKLKDHGKSWDDVIASTLSASELDKEFDDDFGLAEGDPFTFWTKDRVYFPAVYDGSEWVTSVSRNPDGKPTGHVGG